MTKTLNIKIEGLHDIYEFLKRTTQVEGDVTLFRGKYAIDAKSILGVFSIDLSNEVKIEYPDDAKDFDKYISQFMV